MTFACHIQGAGTTESTLTEIFASRSNRQIKVMSEAYLAGWYKIVTQIVVKQLANVPGVMCPDYCEIFCSGAVSFKKPERR